MRISHTRMYVLQNAIRMVFEEFTINNSGPDWRISGRFCMLKPREAEDYFYKMQKATELIGFLNAFRVEDGWDDEFIDVEESVEKVRMMIIRMDFDELKEFLNIV